MTIASTPRSSPPPGRSAPLRAARPLRVAGAVLALGAFAALVVSLRTTGPVEASASSPSSPPPTAFAAGAQEETPVLVSTAWLAERLGQPGLVVVHVGMGRDGIPAELIRGARWIDYHDFAASERGGLIVEMQPTEQIAAALRTIGISNDSHVVAYGSPGHIPARLFVTLEILGHERVSVLDGGLETWVREERPLASQPSRADPGDFVARPREDIMVGADWIRDRLDDPAVALVDARPASEYRGARSPGGARRGHIPGAYNLYWEELLSSPDDPVLRPLDEVRARYVAAGATDEGVVVSYCYIGMRAAYTYLISRHLGFDTKFYDGSWNEWGSRPDLPVERGS